MTTLQSDCSCCNLPLELKRQLVGLGAKCEKDLKVVYEKEAEKIKAGNFVLNGDTLFNFLAIMGNVEAVELPSQIQPTYGRLSIALDFYKSLDRLSTNLVSLGDKAVLPWEIVLDSFSIARNSNEIIREQIFKALTDLGFVVFINKATGKTCPGHCILDANLEKKTVILDATTRRIASEALHKLNHSRGGYRKHTWTFYNPREAQLILDIVLLRWPDRNTVTPAFYELLEIAKNLPPEVEIPEVRPTLSDSEVITQHKIKVFGINPETKKYIYHKTLWPTVYTFMLNEIRARYNGYNSAEGIYNYILEETEDNEQEIKDKLERVNEYLNDLYDQSKALEKAEKNGTSGKRGRPRKQQ